LLKFGWAWFVDPHISWLIGCETVNCFAVDPPGTSADNDNKKYDNDE